MHELVARHALFACGGEDPPLGPEHVRAGREVPRVAMDAKHVHRHGRAFWQVAIQQPPHQDPGRQRRRSGEEATYLLPTIRPPPSLGTTRWLPSIMGGKRRIASLLDWGVRRHRM